MANPLTGDFDAVLQVSESTLNRLLASMHQNAGVKTNLPSFPHSVGLRIGDPTRSTECAARCGRSSPCRVSI